MNRFILIIVSLLIALSANAYFAYMKFTTTDGTHQYIEAYGLNITTDSENLTATNKSANRSLTFKLTALTSMELVEAIGEVEAIEAEINGEIDVYDLNGVKAGHFESVKSASASLEAGIYILKNESGQTVKVQIKK